MPESNPHAPHPAITAALNLGFLLSLPFLAVLKDTGLLFWQKLAAGAALVAAACFAVDRVLFHGILSPERWDGMTYEECLHRASGRTVLLYVIVVAAPIAALLYSVLSMLRI